MTIQSNLPEAVKRQLAEAEAIDKALAGDPAQDPAEAPADPPADPPAPAEPPPAEPPAPAPAPAPAQTPAPVSDDWEQRYRSLKGMYDREVPTLQSQVNELTTSVSKLTEKLTTTPPEPPQPAATGVTEKDREAFGDELLEVVGRVVSNALSPLLARIAELEGKTTATTTQVEQVAKTQTATAQQIMVNRLTELVPDWQAINTDQKFLDWCLTTNPLTGQPNQALLDAASASGDAGRLAAIFTTYKAHAGITPSAPTPAQTPVTPAAKAELESQVQPGTNRPSNPQVPTNEARVFTPREVEQFYIALSKGEYKGQEAKAQALEAEIDRAMAEGRVRP